MVGTSVRGFARMSFMTAPSSGWRLAQLTRSRRRAPSLRSPAQAGVHFSAPQTVEEWVPAFAGKRSEKLDALLVRHDDGAAGGEHATDAVADRDFRARH